MVFVVIALVVPPLRHLLQQRRLRREGPARSVAG
jgi:hypothetical protein